MHESEVDAAVVQAALRARGTLDGVHPSLIDDVRARLPKRACVLPEGTVTMRCGYGVCGCGGRPIEDEYDVATLECVTEAALQAVTEGHAASRY
jgi:hypothetical protein